MFVTNEFVRGLGRGPDASRGQGAIAPGRPESVDTWPERLTRLRITTVLRLRDGGMQDS